MSVKRRGGCSRPSTPAAEPRGPALDRIRATAGGRSTRTRRERSMHTKDVRIALVHLGCARNLIDSETILGRLGSEGYTLTGAVDRSVIVTAGGVSSILSTAARTCMVAVAV